MRFFLSADQAQIVSAFLHTQLCKTFHPFSSPGSTSTASLLPGRVEGICSLGTQLLPHPRLPAHPHRAHTRASPSATYSTRSPLCANEAELQAQKPAWLIEVLKRTAESKALAAFQRGHIFLLLKFEKIFFSPLLIFIFRQ